MFLLGWPITCPPSPPPAIHHSGLVNNNTVLYARECVRTWGWLFDLLLHEVVVGGLFLCFAWYWKLLSTHARIKVERGRNCHNATLRLNTNARENTFSETNAIKSFFEFGGMRSVASLICLSSYLPSPPPSRWNLPRGVCALIKIDRQPKRGGWRRRRQRLGLYFRIRCANIESVFRTVKQNTNVWTTRRIQRRVSWGGRHRYNTITHTRSGTSAVD